MSKTVGPDIYTYNYDTAPVHAVKAINFNGSNYDYIYDENGNMTSGPDFTDPLEVAERSIVYNADNMPVSIAHIKGANTEITDFVYDEDGVRSKKVLQNGICTYYISNEFEVIDGTATKYVFAGSIRIAMISSSGIQYFHKDHLGSSSVITNTNGEKVKTTEHMPFGHIREEMIHIAGMDTSNYKYTDQELDPETGLYNYNARLYNPVLGIFITPDTIVPDPYDPQTLNRYAYCRNNPLIYVDPSGQILGLITSMFVGAVLNGTVSSAMGGDFWDGALTGAISFGMFYGADFALTAATTDARIWGFTQVGVMSGGINSGITGGDIGIGMLTGGLSGGLSEYFGGGLFDRSLIGGTTGGIAAELAGGDFGQGFAGGVTSAIGMHIGIAAVQRTGISPGGGPDGHRQKRDALNMEPVGELKQSTKYGDNIYYDSAGNLWAYRGLSKEHGGHHDFRGLSPEVYGSQVIYSKGGGFVPKNINTSLLNKGTYDFCSPINPNTGRIIPIRAVGHYFVDCIPWVLWGN